jgi:glucoamylase
LESSDDDNLNYGISRNVGMGQLRSSKSNSRRGSGRGSRFNVLRIFAIGIFAIAGTFIAAAQMPAPGASGKDAQWATAGKQGVGTANNSKSKVWFTLAQGVMTEVYYPDVTTANVHLLQFVVVDPMTHKVETEQDDAIHQVKVPQPDSLTFQQINTSKTGAWKITKTYVTDPQRDSVLIDVMFEPRSKDLALYAYYDPSLGNSGMGDSAFSDHVLASTNVISMLSEDVKSRVGSAVTFSSPVSEMVSGYYGVSDGLEQLRRSGKITSAYTEARDGNVAQLVRVAQSTQFTAVISFAYSAPIAALTAGESLAAGFEKVRSEYESGWADYVRALPRVDPRAQAQFNMAAMILKAHEDKTHPGANVASLTVPWGGGENANENNVGGYHLVWSRDLYEVATAYMALGDRSAANRALDFLFNVQQKKDGSFPQNSWLDGKPGWDTLQMDEVSYPLILAWQLGRKNLAAYKDHIKQAADFIVHNGPATPQERWEEMAGYSPSTMAAEIAGLVCAADIAKQNGDRESAARYLATADDWARSVEQWTATTNGKYGDGDYYLRITQHGKPNAGERVELKNGAGFFDEREIVDAGFLELVRLGIKPPHDPLIAKSVNVIDQLIKVDTPHGPGFYRYNHDGYGEMYDGRRWNFDGTYRGQGHPWALLSGERGEYEIARCSESEIRSGRNVPNTKSEPCLASAMARLYTMLAFANDGLMIPEQVWDKRETPANFDSGFIPELKFGEGTGSATPLAWSMAQFIRLAMDLKAGRNLDTPQIVRDRYRNGVPKFGNSR